MPNLPPVVQCTPGEKGIAYYLCLRKEEKPTRAGGSFLLLTLQDRTGRIPAKIFDNVDKLKLLFGEGEFVKVEGGVELYEGRRELRVHQIRRVDAERDPGFRQEDCVPVAARPLEEMWTELQTRLAAVADDGLRALLSRIVADHGDRLRIWPAAMTVHHAYRHGLLEHVLQVARVAEALADIYGADRDLVFAGALLHDIGKLQEMEFVTAATYTLEGNLVGHIALGLLMVREASVGLSSLSARTRTLVEHLVASHHGTYEHGSPVEPKSVEAMILATADELDARLHQVRRAIDQDEGDGEFTAYERRLGRVLLKPERSS